MKTFRKIDALSPTGLFLWESNKDEYYKKYLSPIKVAPLKQTQPMAVGNAFDAYVKAKIMEVEVEDLLKKQVEEYNYEWAKSHGLSCYQQYVKLGGERRVLDCLATARSQMLDFTGTRIVDGVPLLGKPDLFYHTNLGQPVVLDWKVNGWCSYTEKRPDSGHIGKADCYWLDGVGDVSYTSIKNKQWYDQLCVYGLVVGEKSVIGWIEQLCCCDGDLIQVAVHRGVIDCMTIMDRMKSLWSVVQDPLSYWTLEQTDVLDSQCAAMSGDNAVDVWLRDVSGRV